MVALGLLEGGDHLLEAGNDVLDDAPGGAADVTAPEPRGGLRGVVPNLLERLRDRHGRPIVADERQRLDGIGSDRRLFTPEPRRLQFPLAFPVGRRLGGDPFSRGEDRLLGAEHRAQAGLELHEEPLDLLLAHLTKDLLELRAGRLQLLDRLLLFLSGVAAFGLLDLLLRLLHPLGGRLEAILSALRPRRLVVAIGWRLGLIPILPRFTTPLPFGRLAPRRRLRRAPLLSLSRFGLRFPFGRSFPLLRFSLRARLRCVGFW